MQRNNIKHFIIHCPGIKVVDLITSLGGDRRVKPTLTFPKPFFLDSPRELRV